MPRLAKAAPYLIVAAAVAVVFGRAVGFDFVTLDDPINVTQNPFYRPLTLANLARLLSVAYCGLFIPLTYAFWALLALVSRVTAPSAEVLFDPRVYHLANLLLHAGCGVFVYRIALRLVGSPVASGLGTLVFLVHPLQVESVCWVTEAKGLLASFFSLAALSVVTDLLAANVEPPAAAVTRSRGYLWATLLFGLALLSKPSAVTLPLVVVCVLWLGYRWPLATAARTLWDWFFIAAVWVVVTRVAQPMADMPAVSALWERPFIAGDALAFYMGKLVWPWPLTIDYGRTPAVAMAGSWCYVAWLVPLAVAAAAWLTGNAAIRAGTAIALVAPLPVLGLLPFQFQRFSTVADRYTYLSLVGVALVVAAVVARLPRMGAVGVAVAVLLLGSLSWQQSFHWRSGYDLLSHAMKENPRSIAVLVNLGVVHQQRSEFDEAARCFEQALKIDPDGPEANIGEGTVYLREKNYPAALACFEKALARQPLADRANAGAGTALHNMGDTRRAVEHYRRAPNPDLRKTMPTLSLNERASICNALARILATDGDETLRNGAEAVQWAVLAVELTGQQSAVCLDTYAAALAEDGDFDEAGKAEARAIALARAAKNAPLVERLEAHARLFESRKPLRETPAEQLAQ